MDAAFERSGEFQCQNGGGYKNVILHRIDRLAGDSDDFCQPGLGESGRLAAFSQVCDEFHAILSVP